ncbi:glycosyltransferase [Shimia biformata]|uniref:glycosyltransferase n=1 Tax=Shimia biformata TaxID=1294299 RepID=UPI00308413B9
MAGAGQLAAVIVTYNRLDKLQATVARFLESPALELAHLVVVDNASSDGTADWLATQTDPRLSVLRMASNTGGAGGFEAGMRHAVAGFDPDWLLLTDDDGRPAPGALAAFHALDLSRWDAVAAAVYFPDGAICEMNRPSRNPFWHGREFLRTLLRGGGRNGFHLDPAAYDAGVGRPVDITSFVGFFISRAGVVQAGYPDPGLFIYGDDGIYTLELSRRGGRIGFEPSVRFEHDCSTFGSDQRGRFRPLWKVYYYHRNLLLLYRLAAGWLFWPLMCLILPKWLLKVRYHKGERRAFLRLLGAAVGDGLRRRLGRGLAAVTALAGVK